MKLLTLGVVAIACFTAFAQETTQQQIERGTRQLRQAREISDAIRNKQPFELPGSPLGTAVRVTAGGVTDDGTILRLTGNVEIRTDSLIIQSEEVDFHWVSQEIEPRGNVRVKTIPR